MKKISLLSILFTAYFAKTLHAQTVMAAGAHINASAQVIKNLKTDFKAKGNGHSDDQDAFLKAADFINKRGGNVKLIIPGGTYRVGRQFSNVGHANYDHQVYSGEIVMYLLKVNNVSITGAGSVKIIYKDSLKFGTFDTATGKIPAEKDFYNPSAPKGQNKIADYSPTALIGNFLQIINCGNIEVKNLELDGNSDKYILGGTWGAGPNPMELANCYGIRIFNSADITLYNLNIHHFGVDNLLLESECRNKDTALPLSHNILINKLRSSYSGRNGFSWTGGKNIAILNSSFSNSGTGRIKTSPSYGMNIEPEGEPGHILCVNGYFENNVYRDNAGLALTGGTSIDDIGLNGGYGYSYNHYFKNCVISGRYSSAMYNFINRITFDGCKFYGNVLNYGSSSGSIPPVVFKNCYFSDKYKNEIFKNRKLLSMALSYKLQVINCVFEKYDMTPESTYIYEKDGDSNPCNDDGLKPLFADCIFKFFPNPTDAVIFACNGRKITFKNNKFYKKKSDNIRWANIPGCKPDEGEGCTDLGDGLQYFTF